MSPFTFEVNKNKHRILSERLQDTLNKVFTITLVWTQASIKQHSWHRFAMRATALILRVPKTVDWPNYTL